MCVCVCESVCVCVCVRGLWWWGLGGGGGGGGCCYQNSVSRCHDELRAVGSEGEVIDAADRMRHDTHTHTHTHYNKLHYTLLRAPSVMSDSTCCVINIIAKQKPAEITCISQYGSSTLILFT